MGRPEKDQRDLVRTMDLENFSAARNFPRRLFASMEGGRCQIQQRFRRRRLRDGAAQIGVASDGAAAIVASAVNVVHAN